MTSRTPARHALAAALTLALLPAACGTTAPTPAPTSTPTPTPAITSVPASDVPASSRPAVEVYAEIRTAVEAIRGLKPTKAVEPVVIDETQLRANLAAEFDAARTPEQLKDGEDLLIALGLLPAGASLRQLTLDFQGGQVAGYYSPDRDELFVVQRSGGIGPVAESTYAHEFTHQLQDQHVDLDALGTDVADQSDRSLARLALVEGDATSVQTRWMAGNLTAKELGEILAAALDPAAVAAMQNAPPFLRDTATFPYQDGLGFVSRLLSTGGYASVDAAFADPPDSTEQVLHPEKYVTREAPVPVTLTYALSTGLGSGWKVAAEDTLGELILRIWLVEGGVTLPEARTASAGWGGDRVALLRGPDGAVRVVLGSEWDTAADADEFAVAARTALGKMPLGGSVVRVPGTKTVQVLVGGASSLARSPAPG
jgi:type IV pilus biogenesis protein CpaD/CtpE